MQPLLTHSGGCLLCVTFPQGTHAAQPACGLCSPPTLGCCPGLHPSQPLCRRGRPWWPRSASPALQAPRWPPQPWGLGLQPPHGEPAKAPWSHWAEDACLPQDAWGPVSEALLSTFSGQALNWLQAPTGTRQMRPGPRHSQEGGNGGHQTNGHTGLINGHRLQNASKERQSGVLPLLGHGSLRGRRSGALFQPLCSHRVPRPRRGACVLS